MHGQPIDRRSFLAGAGRASLALATACAAAEQEATGALSQSLRGRPSPRRPGPPVPRTLRDAIRGPVFDRNSSGFASVARIYNERFDGVRPRAVAQPLDTVDVRNAVRWAVTHDVRLVARSGGHSYAGYSTIDDGVVLDLARMRAIRFDRGAGTATVSGGAQLIDVYATLADHGATIPAGSCPSVGITGVTLGGGMGLAGRAFGLTADNLLAVQLVTADGRVRQVDRRSDGDLLWALRGGGGGNFGVATQLTFRLHRLPRAASWFLVSWPWSSASDVLAAWQAWAPHARDALTSVLHLETGAGELTARVAGQYLGPASDLPSLLASLSAVPGARVRTGDQDYRGLQMRWAGCMHRSVSACHTVGTRPGGTIERASFHAKSDYVNRALSSGGRAALVSAVERRRGLPGSGGILCDSYGGAVNRIGPHQTAFIHRDALYSIQYLSYGGGAAWLRSTHAAMRPHVSGLAYQNYIDPELRDWRHAYYGSNYRRLVDVQRRVDPHHFFRFPQAIGA
jgi:hypothetical protein